MKRLLILALVLVFLTGCGKTNTALERALRLREKMQSSDGCSFDVNVTADYTDWYYVFLLRCHLDKTGEFHFTVIEPDTIEGITGRVSQAEGNLIFDDQVLLFDTMAQGQITPVSAPWLLMKTLQSGYINACDETEDGLFVVIDDSYFDDALRVEIWTDPNDLPVRAEILWQGRRILSMDVENFSFL